MDVDYTVVLGQELAPSCLCAGEGILLKLHRIMLCAAFFMIYCFQEVLLKLKILPLRQCSQSDLSL